MKLRLQSNSVRFRLKQAEVRRLGEVGRVEETIIVTPTGQGTFRYVLEMSDRSETLAARFSDNTLSIEIPTAVARHWITSHDVGLEARLRVAHDIDLHVMIEKDFACLAGGEEQNVDTFPNPLAGTTC